MAKVGQPTSYTVERATKICALIADGKSVRSICKAQDMPSTTTVYTWLSEQPDFLAQYTRAREDQADAIFDECLAIADEAEAETVQQAKLQIDTRKWMAGKLRPKKYNDKVIMEHSGPDGGAIESVTRIEQVIVDPNTASTDS
jgi:hypothetical protein